MSSPLLVRDVDTDDYADSLAGFAGFLSTATQTGGSQLIFTLLQMNLQITAFTPQLSVIGVRKSNTK